MMKANRREFLTNSAIAVAGVFLSRLFGWSAKGETIPFKFSTEQKYRIGTEVYAADLVKPEELWVELGDKGYGIGIPPDGLGSIWFARENAVFKKDPSNTWGCCGPGGYLPSAMRAMENRERFTGDRLSKWFELRWASDEERGGPNHHGVSPRMLLLLGTVYEERSG